jgi:asparagine synthase (glutamine-hydrolysing)
MSASLEVRSPFLDYRVVEFARSLPIEFRYQPKNKKRILKDLLFKHVPKEMFDRPKKGFSVPIEEWFRNELKDFMYDLLSEKNIKLIDQIDMNEVEKILAEHVNGKKNNAVSIWNLIVLTQWLKNNG